MVLPGTETKRPTESAETKFDRHIRQSVDAAIRKSGYPYWNEISISAIRGRVVLRGKVPSYYAKQLAQTAAMSCEGVSSIQNDLCVN
jgi:osmotically-inducible protein OsmY